MAKIQESTNKHHEFTEYKSRQYLKRVMYQVQTAVKRTTVLSIYVLPHSVLF